MEKRLVWIGRAAGAAGALLTVIAVAVRASGQYVLGSIQLTTLLQAGIAGMVLGCLCLLAVLTRDPNKGG